MQIKRIAAALSLGLAALLSPAWAADEPTGAAACLECHDDLPDMSQGPHGEAPRKKPPMDAAALAMRGSPMADAADPRTPNCISCHGPSPMHVKKAAGQARALPDRLFIGASAQPATQRSATCMACHNSGAKMALWAGSQHPSTEVACNDCHKVHTNHDKVMSKATQTEVCFACHKEQRAQINRPSRHPIQEAKMSCSSCHNPHGSSGPRLVKRDTVNDTCYTCHAEKRGPFVHPHQPVADNCGSCHNPHGSTVPAMLVQRPPLLCQQCHTPHVAGGVGAVGGQPGVFPPAAPGQASPAVTGNSSGKNVVNIWQGRGCTNCHTQVHGSNNPSATNPTPQFMFR